MSASQPTNQADSGRRGFVSGRIEGGKVVAYGGKIEKAKAR